MRSVLVDHVGLMAEVGCGATVCMCVQNDGAAQQATRGHAKPLAFQPAQQAPAPLLPGVILDQGAASAHGGPIKPIPVSQAGDVGGGEGTLRSLHAPSIAEEALP